MKCRNCDAQLKHVFLDLGSAPPSNAYLTQEQLQEPETFYPLKVSVCSQCWLVQTEDYTSANILFSADYAYFSSTSSGWLKHASDYAEMIIKRLALDSNSMVLEIASNDGYLLKNFVAANIPCLGIEPTDSTANAAALLGIEVIRDFFGQALAENLNQNGIQADLICGNNVYAHVPDIKDFTRGLKAALKKNGVINLEFPHLLELISNNQFDTVYHEHFSYLSLGVVTQIFEDVGLRVFDVDKLPTHGGSLRIYGCHKFAPRTMTNAVTEILRQEKDFGLQKLSTYNNFQPKANKVKDDLVSFLAAQNKLSKTIVGYGAAAKGNTLLNYAGMKNDIIKFICDKASSKQGKYMPGSHIPILSPDEIKTHKPDWILIFPWNIADEIIEQLGFIRQWGGKFVIPIPELRIIE